MTIIGPKTSIDKLKAKNVVLSCDLTEKKGEKIQTGEQEYKVTVVISGVNGVWTYGSYNATVSIKEK